MPVLHLRVVAHVDGHPLFVAARRVSLTEYAVVDRDALSQSAQDSGLFGASPSAMLLTVDGGATIGFAGDSTTNAVVLEAGGMAALTNALDYVTQADALGTRIRGLG